MESSSNCLKFGNYIALIIGSYNLKHTILLWKILHSLQAFSYEKVGKSQFFLRKPRFCPTFPHKMLATSAQLYKGGLFILCHKRLYEIYIIIQF